MNISTGDLLKNSFVLSIYGDRIDMLKKIFGYHKLICPKIFYGFKNPDIWKIFKDSKTPTRDGNAYKCSLGHASIVKAAKALELPYVLIFEDDTYPVDEINKKMDYYLSDIPKDASILLLGWSYTKTKPKQISDKWSIPAQDTHGSHAYVIFSHAYDKYLEIYDNKPTIPSDDMMMKIGHAYMANECLFIQYNMNKSNWGCVGYIFEYNQKQYQTASPPPGFSKIDDIIEMPIPEFMRNPMLLQYLDKCVEIGKFKSITNKSRCIIIESGLSIQDFDFGNLIDSSDAYVIRLNRPPEEKYFKNYGCRTDLFFGCEYLKDLLDDMPNKAIVGHSLIQAVSKYFTPGDDKWLTTGMVAILLFSRVFEKIDIFGFGTYGECCNSKLYSSINESKPIPTHHNIAYEHALLDKLEDCRILRRMESYEKQYRIS